MNKNKGSAALIIVLLVILVLAVGGFWYYHSNQSPQVSVLSQPSSSPSAAITTSSGKNVVDIKELGILVTVPDAVRDITYVTSSFKNDFGIGMAASFSTKTFTAIDHQCAASGVAPPLGTLVRIDGQYPAEQSIAAGGVLIKQFSRFYIAYAHAQAACWATQQGATYAASLPAYIFTSSTVAQLPATQ